MNKYNERMLKNVLEDIREENDIKLQQEAEDAASNPLFANNTDSDRRFNEALAEIEKSKKRKHHRKTLIRVASVFFAILIGLSAVTLSVKGFREKLWEIIRNIGNPSYSLMVSSDNPNDRLLADYEGLYIPKYIPEGYEVVSVNNKEHSKTIKYQNSSGNVISFAEHTQDIDKKFNLDKEDFNSYETYKDDVRQTVIATKDNVSYIVLKENNIIIHVIVTDTKIDIKSFADMIEKK